MATVKFASSSGTGGATLLKGPVDAFWVSPACLEGSGVREGWPGEATAGCCTIAVAMVAAEDARSGVGACTASASGFAADLESPVVRLTGLLTLEAYMEASFG